MVLNQSRSNRKPSGARYKRQTVRRQHEAGRSASLTKVDSEDRRKVVRTIGGNEKQKSLLAHTVQVSEGNTVSTETIVTVRENPANRHFVRRNILTKGTILETSKGLARVSNRPGQTGVVQAVRVTE